MKREVFYSTPFISRECNIDIEFKNWTNGAQSRENFREQEIHAQEVTRLRSKVFSLKIHKASNQNLTSPSLKYRVKCGWGLGVKDLA